MNVVRLNGPEERLYALVTPLVILKQNSYFLFKTTELFCWFVFVEICSAITFLPVENRGLYYRIDSNYAPVTDQRERLLMLRLNELKDFYCGSIMLRANVLIEDTSLFIKAGFKVIRESKRYRLTEY